MPFLLPSRTSAHGPLPLSLPPVHCPSPSSSALHTLQSPRLPSPSPLISHPGGPSILATCRPVYALGCCYDFTAGAGLWHPQEHKQTPHLPRSSWTGNFHTDSRKSHGCWGQHSWGHHRKTLRASGPPPFQQGESPPVGLCEGQRVSVSINKVLRIKPSFKF